MDDLDRLSSDFEKAQTQTKRDLSKIVLDAGGKVASDARALAPVGATGDLRDGIEVYGASKTLKNPYGGKGLKVGLSAAAGDLSVEVVSTAWYSHFVERGTSRSAPQPFLGPAFDSNVEKFVKDVLDVGATSLW